MNIHQIYESKQSKYWPNVSKEVEKIASFQSRPLSMVIYGKVFPIGTTGKTLKIDISATERDIDTKPKPFDSARRDA